MQIEFKDTQVQERSGESAKGPWTMRTQNGLMWKAGEEYPDKMKVTLGKGQAPHPVGRYELHDSSYVVNPNGGIELSRFDMQFVMVFDANGKPIK